MHSFLNRAKEIYIKTWITIKFNKKSQNFGKKKKKERSKLTKNMKNVDPGIIYFKKLL